MTMWAMWGVCEQVLLLIETCCHTALDSIRSADQELEMLQLTPTYGLDWEADVGWVEGDGDRGAAC